MPSGAASQRRSNLCAARRNMSTSCIRMAMARMIRAGGWRGAAGVPRRPRFLLFEKFERTADFDNVLSH